MFDLLNAINEPIVVGDNDGNIVFLNTAASSLLGLTDAAQGSPLTILMPERYRVMHTLAIDRLKTNAPLRLMGQWLILDALKNDGVEIPIRMMLNVATVENKRYFVAQIQDMRDNILVSKEELKLL